VNPPVRASRLPDPFLKRDLLKIVCVLILISITILVFFLTPGLSAATATSLIATLLLSPWVAALERKGLRRASAVSLIFLGLAAGLGSAGTWGFRSALREWEAAREKAPVYLRQTTERLLVLEKTLKDKYPVLQPVKPAESITNWAAKTGDWFLHEGPKLAGELVTTLILGPILVFFLLMEGQDLRRSFFRLIPNRIFETVFSVTHEVTSALGDYLRAKLIEAFLVGLLTTLGLLAIGAPYAFVLGMIAGVTNILPYIGPVIGAVPALLIPLVDPSHSALLWPILIVMIGVNVIDTILIFPVVVAKLVNLHPLILLASVMVGQEYYGLIGMLVSIPVASTFKILAIQVGRGLYEVRSLPPGSAG
jgi:putative permease